MALLISFLCIIAIILIAICVLSIVNNVKALFAYNKIQDLQINMLKETDKSQDKINNYYGERITALELQLNQGKNDEKEESTDE